MSIAPISTFDDAGSFLNLAGDPTAFQNAIRSLAIPDSASFPASSYTPQTGSSPFQSTFYDPGSSQSQDQILGAVMQIMGTLLSSQASGSDPGSSPSG